MKQTAVEWLMQQLPTIDKYEPYYEDLFTQAKAMEEKQMINFAEFVATYNDKNKNVNGEMLHAKSKYDGAKRTIDLLEQYYNETFKSK